jgi:glycosyltransferase involved in cell wall biosynthesis
MRLLALTTSHEEGGAEWHLRMTLAAARAAGHEVSVALPSYDATKRLRAELTEDGHPVHSLPIGREGAGRAGAYAAIVRDALATLWIIARVRPDAVLLNLPTAEASPGAMLACRLARVPTTAIFLLVRADLRTSARRRQLYAFLARRQRWLCNSDHNRVTLAAAFGVPAGAIGVIRNGIDPKPVEAGARARLRSALDVPEDGTLVLTTARLSAQKDHRVIVEALPELAAHEELVFGWAGDGPLREQLTAEVRAAGQERRVRFLGRRSDVPELLAAADLFLMPSRDEGGAPPFALAEAMHAGVPVIVSDAGALAEVIRDRVNGMLFSRGDASDLARVIEWTLANQAPVADIAARAREQAGREFTTGQMTAEVLGHLEDQFEGVPMTARGAG